MSYDMLDVTLPLTEDIRKFMKHNERCILAGGAVRRLLEHRFVPAGCDYDFFFRAEADISKAINWLCANGYDEKFTSDWAETFVNRRGTVVQIIKKSTYSSPEAVLDSFDLTAGMFAYELAHGGPWLLVTSWGMQAIVSKTLALHSVSDPISTMRRLGKFRAEGWKIPLSVYTQLGEYIANNPQSVADDYLVRAGEQGDSCV
jgi:hypothetical protein